MDEALGAAVKSYRLTGRRCINAGNMATSHISHLSGGRIMGKEAESEYSYVGTFEISSKPKTKKMADLPGERSLEETNKLLEELIADKEEVTRLSPAGID